MYSFRDFKLIPFSISVTDNDFSYDFISIYALLAHCDCYTLLVVTLDHAQDLYVVLSVCTIRRRLW